MIKCKLAWGCKRFVAVALAVLLMACTSPTRQTVVSTATSAKPADVDKLLVVDCLLPGQIRKLGSSLTYLTPRRPLRTSALDCEIRGGEYVAHDRADYRTALNAWLPQAQAGDAQAQNYVGEIYEQGLGLAPDYMTAAQWYRKAAEQGLSEAAINLGYLYETGLGLEKDLSQALNWYRRASGLQGDDLQFASSIEVQAATAAAQEVAALRQQTAQQQQETVVLRQRLAQTESQLTSRRRALERAEQELQVLRQQRQSQSVQTTSPQAEVAELSALEAQLAQQQAVVAQQRDEMQWLLGEFQQQRTALEQQLSQAQNQQQSLNQALSDQSQEAAYLHRKLNQTQAELSAARTQLEQLQPQLDNQRSALQHARQALSQDTQANAAARTALQAEVQRLEQNLAAKQAETNAQQARIERLETTLRDTQRVIRQPVPAAAQVSAMPGPRIEIIDPPVVLTRGGPTVQLRSATRERVIVGKVTAAAGLKSLTVNDHNESVDSHGLFQVKVPVQAETTPVNVVAIDRYGQHTTVDFTLVASLNPIPPAVPSVAASSATQSWHDIDFGQYHALIIANQGYQHFPDLASPHNDAAAVERLLKDRYGFKTTVIRDGDRYTVLSALERLRAELTEQDNLLIYYAGHGELDALNQSGYWLPVNAEPDSRANWIAVQQVTEILETMSAKNVLVVADSCYSGIMTRTSLARLQAGMSDSARTQWMRTMSGVRSRLVLTSGGVKPVLDSGAGEHSIFARAFLAVLENNTDVLEGYKLFRAVADRVQKAAAKFQMEQTPEFAPIRHSRHQSGEFFFVPVASQLSAVARTDLDVSFKQ